MANPHYPHYQESHHGVDVPWKISDVVLVYFWVIVLSIIFTGILLYINLDIDSSLYAVVFQMLISFSILGFIYYTVTLKYNMSFSDAFGITSNNLSEFINQGLLVTIIMLITTTSIGMFFAGFNNGQAQNPYTEMSDDKLRLLIGFALFFAPIVEEIFFRGFMQPALMKKIGVMGGIIATALIFGFSHAQYIGYPGAMISVIAIGLILGVTRYKTGSVMPGIFAHFFNNLLAVMYIMR